MSSSNERTAAADQHIFQLLLGKFVTQALTVANNLEIAGQLRDGAHSAAALAAKAGVNEDALYRVLRVLAAAGVFTELEGRRFENNAASHLLRSDVTGSLHSMVRWINDPCAWSAWGRLDYSVRTGKPAFDEVFGMPMFQYMTQSENAGSFKAFQEAMTGLSSTTGQAVVDAYDFTGISKIVDVGGGHGLMLSQIIHKHPNMRGVLFDMPGVIAGATEILTAAGHADRIEPVGGDFLEGVPLGADCYIMKFIIHDWDDERAVRILSHCRKAVARGGRVLVVDLLLSDAPEAGFAKLLDLEMLVMTPGGRERSEAEFAALFEMSGLRLSRIVPTQSPVCVIEALPA